MDWVHSKWIDGMLAASMPSPTDEVKERWLSLAQARSVRDQLLDLSLLFVKPGLLRVDLPLLGGQLGVFLLDDLVQPLDTARATPSRSPVVMTLSSSPRPKAA